MISLRTTILLAALAAIAQSAPIDVIRIDRNGNEVSSDLGSYDWFECTGEGSDRQCEFTSFNNIMGYFEVNYFPSKSISC